MPDVTVLLPEIEGETAADVVLAIAVAMGWTPGEEMTPAAFARDRLEERLFQRYLQGKAIIQRQDLQGRRVR